MFSEEQMNDVVKSSLFLPTLPGRFDALDIPGIKGRYAIGVPGGFINRVGGSNLSSEQMVDTVQAVLDHFAALDQNFSWFTISSDSPENLEAHLKRVGFEHSWTLSGMVLAGLTKAIPMHPDVTVKRANPDERHLVSCIYEAGFPMNRAAADLFADMIEIPKMTHYLVYLNNVDEPVGATTAFYAEEQKAIILEASAILEAYRGRGIYKSLIARRIHDAYADGMQFAVVQANVASSAPALRKLGFVEQCLIRSWSWSPKDSAD